MAIELHRAEFQTADIQPESVDVIATDPPYPKLYRGLWPELAMFAMRVLKPGGSLLAITPHYLLPWVIQQWGDAGLKYRWILKMDQEAGPHPRMAMGVEVTWKPILWYVKGNFPRGRGFVKDGFESVSKGAIMAVHGAPFEWMQGLGWAEYMMKFVKPGELACDPMMGLGTLPLVAGQHGVDVIGIEKDADVFQSAVDRLTEARLLVTTVRMLEAAEKRAE
jgi:hypothetical protein